MKFKKMFALFCWGHSEYRDFTKRARSIITLN